MNAIGARPKVYKREPLFWCRNCRPKPVIEKPWTAFLPYGGTHEFDTWREAYECARSYRMPMMMN